MTYLIKKDLTRGYTGGILYTVKLSKPMVGGGGPTVGKNLNRWRIIMELLEFLEANKKYLAKEGDIIVILITGHCGASNVYGTWILPADLEEEVRKRVEEVYERAEQDEFCPYCGLAKSLQWGRYIIRTITATVIEQAEELGVSVEELYEQLYTV